MSKQGQGCIQMRKKSDIATALLGIMTALILWVTILSREKLIGTPIVYTPLHEFLSLWKSIQRGNLGANFYGNIVLFVPIGFLLAIVTGKKRWIWIIGAGFCFSLFIEALQLITSCGSFDPDDIILNTLGTAFGYGLYRVITHTQGNN